MYFLLGLIPMDDEAYGDVERGLAFGLSNGAKTYGRVLLSDAGARLRFCDRTERPVALDASNKTLTIDGQEHAYEARARARARPRFCVTTRMIPRRSFAPQATPWAAFQVLVREKDHELWTACLARRDATAAASAAWRKASDVASFGAIEQPFSEHALALADEFPPAWAGFVRPRLDRELYPRLAALRARVAKDAFVGALRAAFPARDARFHVIVGPIKLAERIAVKAGEYEAEAQAAARAVGGGGGGRAAASQWPFTPRVGDVLRATVTAVDGDAFLEALERVVRTFELREGNGRLKNMLGTTKPMPPRVLINVVVRASGCQPAVAEVQIYASSIKAEADMGHVYYEITRARSLQELITEKKGAAQAKESSDNVSVPTHTQREGLVYLCLRRPNADPIDAGVDHLQSLWKPSF